jgi:hypothetical protein
MIPESRKMARSSMRAYSQKKVTISLRPRCGVNDQHAKEN